MTDTHNPRSTKERTLQLNDHDQKRLRSALRRGRHPLLCWDPEHAWVLTRLKTHEEAASLKELQARRGIPSVYVHSITEEVQDELATDL